MTTRLTPASPTHLAPSYATPAWLLRGLTHEPGVLSLYAGRLRLTTSAGVVFDAPLGAVERLAFPWYHGSSALRITVGGRRHRVTLTRPKGSAFPEARLRDAARSEPGVERSNGVTVHRVLPGRGAGRVWRTLLDA